MIYCQDCGIEFYSTKAQVDHPCEAKILPLGEILSRKMDLIIGLLSDIYYRVGSGSD